VLLGAVGIALVGYAAVGAAGTADIRPGRQALFLLAVLVAHDAVLMPAFLLAGYLVGRHVPASWRASVQGGLIATAALGLVALPLVLGYGYRPDNPSALPRDYGRGLLVTLAVVWGITVAVRLARQGWVRVRRHRAAGMPDPGPGPTAG
jgi:hypothetical protein